MAGGIYKLFALGKYVTYNIYKYISFWVIGGYRRNMKNKIEVLKEALNHAIEKDMKKEVILKISQEIDKCIVEFHKQGNLPYNSRSNSKIRLDQNRLE